jgi:hypothetical protein
MSTSIAGWFEAAPGASRTNITVAAGRITVDLSTVSGGTLARLLVRSGTPPGFGDPWSNLSHPMSLNDPARPPVPVVHTIPRRYMALGLVVVAIVLVAGLIAIRHDTTPNQPTNAETFSPAPQSLVQSVTQIPNAVFNAVGVTSPTGPATPPAVTNTTAVWQASTHQVVALPVVFFYGAEFAPYAAAERWPVIVALARFGTFSQLGLMQTSGTVAFSDLSTFTFSHTTYSSIWVDLQTIERYSDQDLTGAGYSSLQHPDARQASAVSDYDSSNETFPLLDIANRYTLVGSSFTPSVLANMTQAQIAAALSYPDSPVTQAVIASANEITAAICTVTGQRPTAVCDGRGVLAADAKMRISPAS